MDIRIKRLAVSGLFAVASLLAGCGPSPEDVCKKTFDLVKAEAGEAAANKAIGGDLATCTKDEERRKERQGMFKYKSNNECLMSAKDWKEAKACSK